MSDVKTSKTNESFFPYEPEVLRDLTEPTITITHCLSWDTQDGQRGIYVRSYAILVDKAVGGIMCPPQVPLASLYPLPRLSELSPLEYTFEIRSEPIPLEPLKVRYIRDRGWSLQPGSMVKVRTA